MTTRVWFFCALFFPAVSMAGTRLDVVTSIRPLQIITNDIMRGAGHAQLLIGANQSPHHFQLKPSQMRLASRADLLIWISDDFETGLSRLQRILSDEQAKLTLLPQLNHQQNRNQTLDADGHIWLSPDIVIDIARLIERKLSQLDPSNGALFRRNRERLTASLKQWKQANTKRLHNPEPSYIVDHRFLSHFEQSLGLSSHDSLRDSHDSHAGIRHLSRLQQKLRQTPVKCLLVTSLPPGTQARQISDQFGIKLQLINTLGKTGDEETTINFFNDIVTALEPCR